MIKDYYVTLQLKEQLAGDIWKFVFGLSEGDELSYEAGQYMILKVDNFYRQYSIASPVSQKRSFDLVVELFEKGIGSDLFRAIQVGEQAFFRGPAGVFILRNTPVDKVFLATGTGIAPIRAMVKTHLEEKRPGNIHLFFGLRYRADLYFVDEFEKLANEHPQLHFSTCLSKEESLEGLSSSCIQGRVNVGLEKLWQTSDVKGFEYYICGSRTAVDSLKDFVIERGAMPDHVFFERFTL